MITKKLIYQLHLILIQCIVLTSIAYGISNESVLIITCSHHKPEFLELQQKTFAKFLKNPYKFIVINDAPSEEMAQKIENTCKKIDAHCLRFHQGWHNLPYIPHNEGLDYNFPSLRHSNCMQFGLNMVGLHHNGVVLIIDNDAFLVQPFDINQYMSDCDIAGFLRPAIDWSTKLHIIYDYKHLWPPVMMFNMSTLPNKQTLSLSAGLISPNVWVDSGGGTYTYLKNNPHARLKEFNLLNFNPIPEQIHPNFLQFGDPYYTLEETKDIDLAKHIGLDDKAALFLKKGPVEVQFFLNGVFFHYMSAGNWLGRTDTWHEIKYSLVHEYLSNLLDDTSSNTTNNSSLTQVVNSEINQNNTDHIYNNVNNNEVLILICNSDNPFFIEQQYFTFAKHLKNHHKLIVFSDTPNQDTQNKIQKICDLYNIRYVKLENTHKDQYIRESYSLQYAFEKFALNHKGLVVFVNSEIFLTRPLNLEKYMQGYQIGGYLRNAQNSLNIVNNYTYLWPTLMILDMNSLPDKELINLQSGYIKENVWTECGGNTYHYLSQHPNLKIKRFNILGINIIPSLLNSTFKFLNIPYYTVGQSKKLDLLRRLGFTEIESAFIITGIPNIQYIADNNFIHYMSNLINSSSANLEAYKHNIFKDYLQKILK